MPLIPIPNNSDLTTYFTTGQRKALDTLGNVIIDALLLYLQNNPSELNLSLDELVDVNAPSPVSGDNLQFDGTNWVAVESLPQIITNSTTSRTASLSDSSSYIRFTNGSATTYTIPPQSSVAWLAGSQIEFEQGGAGAVTVQGGSGVTIRVNAALTAVTNGQYAVAGLKRIAENEWVLFGNLVPA